MRPPAFPTSKSMEIPNNTFDLSALIVDDSSELWDDNRFESNQSTEKVESEKFHLIPKIPLPIPLPQKIGKSASDTNNGGFYHGEHNQPGLGEMTSDRSSSRQFPTSANESFSSLGIQEFIVTSSVRTIPKPQKFSDRLGESLSDESFSSFRPDVSNFNLMEQSTHMMTANDNNLLFASPVKIPKPLRISESISNGSTGSTVPELPDPVSLRTSSSVSARTMRRKDSPKRYGRRSSSTEDFETRLSQLSRRSNTDHFEIPSGDIDFSSIPKMPRPGERTASIALRLEAQGFRQSAAHNNFPLKSITRGTDDWLNLLKPFVSNIIFRSLEYRRYQSEISFRPYTCQAAVLFVDLSNYSKITAAISNRGAHAISSVVNAYLERILGEVNRYGGDVVKFAGDAVLIVWEGKEDELFKNVLTASRCAIRLQKICCYHRVEGINLQFRIHCGLSCGGLESEIFQAPTHINMQRFYHSVGGESIRELSELVDMAKAGEVCISEDCVKSLNELGVYKEVEGYHGPARLLLDLNLGSQHQELVDDHIQNIMGDRLFLRTKHIEENFIHPAVLNFLSHGGLSPTQIAQIRNLCVLFIAMTSQGSSVNWLMEVQSVLDNHRCPVVQIIDDDKGVHIIAAINLYESDPYASVLALTVCEILESKQVGCAIGMALGSTFCGVTGCSRTACRWDITGPPAVRAARLMQYALKQGLQMAIDQSVFDDPLAATRLKILHSSVVLKGSPSPVTVYTLSDRTLSSVFGILDTSYGRVHKEIVKQIEQHLRDESTRCAVIISGIPLAGKKTVCQLAAGQAGFVPYLHVSSKCAGFLQVALTVALWFQYSESETVKDMAASVLENLRKQNWSRSHDDCILLVDEAISNGMRACFVVDGVHFLDEFSLSLIRECLKPRCQRLERCHRHSYVMSDTSEERPLTNSNGKICFLCVHECLYNEKSASNIAEDLCRSNRNTSIPIINLGKASEQELKQMFADCMDVELDGFSFQLLAKSSRYFAGCFIERSGAIGTYMGTASWKPTTFGLSKNLTLFLSDYSMRKIKKVPLTMIRPEISMRFTLIFDELPPLFQTFLKVLCMATRTEFFKLPRSVMWLVLNDLIASGIEAGEYSIVIDEMKEMSLIEVEDENDETVLSVQSPALVEIAFDVSTPAQVDSIAEALLERLEAYEVNDFRILLVMADLECHLDKKNPRIKELLRQGLKSMIMTSEIEGWPSDKLRQWKLIILDEIEEAGYTAEQIAPDDSERHFSDLPSIPNNFCSRLLLMKEYCPPMALGPMSRTIASIYRTTFHELGFLNGYSHETVEKIVSDRKSAIDHYFRQAAIIERFLSCYSCSCDEEELDAERTTILELLNPAENLSATRRKVTQILDQINPSYISSRVSRLYRAVTKLRQEAVPNFMINANRAIHRAYQTLRGPKSPLDSVQEALMILTTLNWSANHIPNHHPRTPYTTVASLRNKLLTKRNDVLSPNSDESEKIVLEFEAFLVVTALLDRENKIYDG